MIAAKTRNPRGFRYGSFRVWGDLEKSRYFKVDDQPDVSNLIRSLSVKANAKVLGQSFQGDAAVRQIDGDDHKRLLAYAKALPCEPRARLLPEEKLEALLLAGDEASVARLLKEEPAGIAEERRRYLMSRATRRDRDLVEELRELYLGECQICSWSPRRTYGAEICEAHHVRWLSRGGTDRLENLVLVCPNHHRVIHRCDAPFDFHSASFVFPKKNEPLLLKRHTLESV